MPGETNAGSESASTDRFARIVAICTVVTTLAAAGIGYLEARTISGSGGAKVDAQQLSLDSLARQVDATRAANLQFDRFGIAEQDRLAAMTARSDRLLLPGSHRRLALAEHRREWLAKRTDRVSAQIASTYGAAAITLTGRDGPTQDPHFPDRFFARHTTFGEQRVLAIRDAANEQDAQRAHRISAYTATLAMFGIAVFLFGFSLTPEGRRRGVLFSSTAVGLVVLGASVAIVASAEGRPAPPDAAADAFADGEVALVTGDNRTAIRKFSRAIALHPTFARAYKERATAIFAEGSPQVSGYASLTNRDALQKSNDDLRRSLALGQDSADVLSSLGFGMYAQGLADRNTGLLREAVDTLRRAVRVQPLEPVAAFNLGVALLAVDREADAANAYAAAIPKLVFLDAHHRVRRSPEYQEAIVAGALTDLELLRRDTGTRHVGAIRRRKEQIVGSFAAGGGRITSSRARLANFEPVVFPSQAGWLVESEHAFRPDRDQLSLQWYHREPGLGWAVLPDISGIAGRSEDDYQEDPRRMRRFQIMRSLEVTVPPSCLPAGTYRLEAYLNGHLADVTVAERSDSGVLRADVDRQIGMALCRPRNWRRLADPRLAGVVSSWRSPDGARGAIVMKLDRHVDPRRSGRYDDGDAVRMLDWALRRFPGVLPRPLRRGSIEWTAPFAGFRAAIRRSYAYPARAGRAAGHVLATAGYDADDVGWVGAVFGPGGYVDAQGRDIVVSLTRYRGM
jgi:tetratricopeptide (TPR) repeat protein